MQNACKLDSVNQLSVKVQCILNNVFNNEFIQIPQTWPHRVCFSLNFHKCCCCVLYWSWEVALVVASVETLLSLSWYALLSTQQVIIRCLLKLTENEACKESNKQWLFLLTHLKSEDRRTLGLIHHCQTLESPGLRSQTCHLMRQTKDNFHTESLILILNKRGRNWEVGM